MTDVATTVFSDEPVHNGYVVTAVDKTGNYQTVAPAIIEDVPDHSGLVAKYDNRFDNPTYYSA